MIELLIYACTAVGTCRDISIGIAPTRQACMMSIQMTAAQWVNQHPQFEIRKMTCRSMQPGRDA